MVAAQQDLGDGEPLEVAGPGVVGVLEQPVLEAFLLLGRARPHDAGQEADAGVEQDQRRELAA